jgi:hypothetical protein
METFHDEGGHGFRIYVQPFDCSEVLIAQTPLSFTSREAAEKECRATLACILAQKHRNATEAELP